MTMMLNDLVDPIIAALGRHMARLQLLAQASLPGMSEHFREESARICENDIQNIVLPGYQAVVDAEPDPAKQVRVLADSQRKLKDLLCPRLPQVGNRPDEGYFSIFVEGSVGAARAAYAKISQETKPLVLSAKSSL